MKTLILTLSLMISSLSIFAQNYTAVSTNASNNKRVFSHNDSFLSFTMDVASQEKFKYREFLKESIKSEKTFQIGEQIFTKKELTKLMRKGSRKSENLKEFKEFLNNKNQMLTSYLSNTEMVLLYQTFREGTFQKYIDDLACSF